MIDRVYVQLTQRTGGPTSINTHYDTYALARWDSNPNNDVTMVRVNHFFFFFFL
jgi:hypothetical protein